MPPRAPAARLAIAAGVWLALAGAASAQSNPFSFLFGSRPTPPRPITTAYAPPAAYPGPSRVLAPDGYSRPLVVRKKPLRAKAARVKHEKPRREEAEKPHITMAIRPPVGRGPLGPFLFDPTLRPGDIVTTVNGIMVYEGGKKSKSHTAADFVPVARTSAAKRGDFAKLEQGLRGEAERRAEFARGVALQKQLDAEAAKAARPSLARIRF